jgi:hypothetical protein
MPHYREIYKSIAAQQDYDLLTRGFTIADSMFNIITLTWDIVSKTTSRETCGNG